MERKTNKKQTKSRKKETNNLKMNNVKCQRKKAVKNNFSGISYSGRIMWCQIIWTPSETKVNQCVNGDFTTYYCVIKSPIEIRSFCSFPSISAKTGNLFAILHNHQDSSSPSWFLVLYSTVIWNSEFHSENFVYWGYARFIYSKINMYRVIRQWWSCRRP